MYDRLDCELIAVFLPKSLTDKSIYRKGRLIDATSKKEKCDKDLDFIDAVNQVIREDRGKVSKPKEEQFKLFA